MSQFEAVAVTCGSQSKNQDRFVILEDDQRLVVAVADGAGGSGGGDVAAQETVDEIRRNWKAVHGAAVWRQLLSVIDQRISAGESTATIVELSHGQLCGASVGDSQAWLIGGDAISELTREQPRKPLLGSREASPIEFQDPALAGILLVATDGFCNYVARPRLLRELPHLDFSELPQRLVELVRLPSGDLWDDTTIVACRPRSKLRPRKRYEILEAEGLPLSH